MYSLNWCAVLPLIQDGILVSDVCWNSSPSVPTDHQMFDISLASGSPPLETAVCMGGQLHDPHSP